MPPSVVLPMADVAFAELIAGLTEAFGQQMGSSRQIPEGVLLRTTDGFLYAFIEDTARLSLITVERFITESPGGGKRLILFARGRLPLAFTEALQRAGATVVEGGHFSELARSLGLGSFLGEEPRPGPAPAARLLPSAHLLDALMGRARTWSEWGVPAIALRFYRQAAELKPEFLPARIGIAHSLLALGLLPEAREAYAAVRAAEPTHLEARLGLAAVQGAEGHPELEVAAYRELLAEDPSRLSVRAHLVAALVDHQHWEAARNEIERMLETVPEDAYLRFLLSVAFEKSGSAHRASEERAHARSLGLAPDRERQLCEHLGLSPPPRAETPSPVPAGVATPAVEPSGAGGPGIPDGEAEAPAAPGVPEPAPTAPAVPARKGRARSASAAGDSRRRSGSAGRRSRKAK